MKLGPLQTKWVEALESGEYRQGFGRLHCADGSHCCLGVAQKVLDLFETASGALIESYRTIGLHDSAGYLMLPALCYKPKFTINYDGKNYHINAGWTALTNLNDQAAPFGAIAKLIREYPEYVFKEPR